MNCRVTQSLTDVGFNSLVGLLATYGGQAVDLQQWTAGAEINRDGNLRLQYLAGLALNQSMEGAIYNEILSYRKFPETCSWAASRGFRRWRLPWRAWQTSNN